MLVISLFGAGCGELSCDEVKKSVDNINAAGEAFKEIYKGEAKDLLNTVKANAKKLPATGTKECTFAGIKKTYDFAKIKKNADGLIDVLTRHSP